MGNYAVLKGPATDFAFAARSKSIGGVSSSTPEAELAAANAIIKGVGIPTLDLMAQIRGDERTERITFERDGQKQSYQWSSKVGTQAILYEDNTAAIQIIKTGKSPAMKHLQRHQGINIRLLHDLFHPRDAETCELQESAFTIEYIEPINQRADIFTKAFRDASKWKIALDAIMIGKVPRTSKDMPTQVVVPTTTVAMPAGRGNATAGFVEIPSDSRAALTNMLEDAVRRYFVKGTKSRVNLKPNAPKDKRGKHLEALPSDVIQ